MIAALRHWFSRNPVIAIGTFMSGIFVLLGLIGTIAFFPNVITYWQSAEWPTTDAEILASREVYSIRGRTKRPDFTFRYEWNGQTYTAQGYDLLGATTRESDRDRTREALRAHPIGSHVRVWVNPERPSQAVILRGTTGGLVVHAVPPFFLLLGLTASVFVFAGSRGWLEEKSTNPFGRLVRSFDSWFLQENVMKTVFFGVFGLVIAGLLIGGILGDNYILVGLAAFMGWGLWQATRKRKR